MDNIVRAKDTFIPVYKPDLSGREREYLNECIDTGWISSNGAFIDAFENEFSAYTGIPNAITVANGTVALHLALHALGVGPGDEVLVPAFTYIASVNAIRMCGATPVFTEVCRSDWLMDPEDIASRITGKTRAVMPVHLYSGICDMDAISAVARAHGLVVVEDAAEAFGTTRGGRHAGSWGDASTFSFFGNKTITTGEGGMVVCRDNELATLMRRLKSQGVKQDPEKLADRYWHDLFAYNYRMNNVTAALGLAQLERAKATIERKQEIARAYRKAFADLAVEFQELPADVTSAHWLVTFLLPPGVDRERTMQTLQDDFNVQSRPAFFCAHQMPVFRDEGVSFPVSEEIARRGMSVPSFPSMTNTELQRVIDAVRVTLEGGGA